MRKLIWIAVLLVVVFAGLRGREMVRSLFPLEYGEEITALAEFYELDPYLVSSVILAESRFRPEVVSPKGAVGLMQILPSTAAWIAQESPIPYQTEADLRSPRINLQLGCWYLAYLMREFNGRVPVVLAAYNAGPGTVRRWLNEGRWDGTLANLDSIPFYETRSYLRRVLLAHRIYPILYRRWPYSGRAVWV